MKVRLLIEVLPGKPEIEGKGAQPRGILVRRRAPERLGVPAPAHAILPIQDDPRGVELIGVDVVNLVGLHHLDGKIFQPDEFAQGIAVLVILPDCCVTPPAGSVRRTRRLSASKPWARLWARGSKASSFTRLPQRVERVGDAVAQGVGDRR